jgi:hypothetical protein
VHAMLLDIVIAKQAAVVTAAELAGALPGNLIDVSHETKRRTSRQRESA